MKISIHIPHLLQDCCGEGLTLSLFALRSFSERTVLWGQEVHLQDPVQGLVPIFASPLPLFPPPSLFFFLFHLPLLPLLFFLLDHLLFLFHPPLLASLPPSAPSLPPPPLPF